MQAPKTDVRQKVKNIQKIHIRNKSNQDKQATPAAYSSDANTANLSKRTLENLRASYPTIANQNDHSTMGTEYAKNTIIRFNEQMLAPAQTIQQNPGAINSGNWTEYGPNEINRIHEGHGFSSYGGSGKKTEKGMGYQHGNEMELPHKQSSQVTYK